MKLSRLFPVLACLWVLLRSLHGDVISTTGNIFIDINSDGSTDVTMSTDGLGVGATPSANLHVSGNAVVTDGNVMIGTSTANSTLEVSGTIGYGVQAISTNATLEGNSIVLVDCSSGNIALELPGAAHSKGRIYTIKKKDNTNTLSVMANFDLGIDGQINFDLVSVTNGTPYMSVVSGGNEWHILSQNGATSNSGSGNLCAWWKFDEANVSGNAVDSTGNGYFADYTSMEDTQVVTGRFGNALDFTNSGNYVIEGSDSDTSIGGYNNCIRANENHAWSMWVKIDNLANAPVFISANTSTNRFVSEFGTSGEIYWGYSAGAGGTRTYPASTVSTGQWYHICGVKTGAGDSGDLYVNGVKQTSFTGALSSTNATAYRMLIGRYWTGTAAFDFDGIIDDVRLYNKSLTESEVQALYQMGN